MNFQTDPLPSVFPASRVTATLTSISMSRTDRQEPKAANAQWFTTTHWSVVLAAGQQDSTQSAEALEILCQQYWPAVYAFIRRRGHGPDDAQDLTQEFFSRLLEKKYVESADASKGRFRTFLLTAVTRFLVNEREWAQAQKRGGGRVHFSLEDLHAEDRVRNEPADTATPETIYERRWAETVLEAVLARLRHEYESVGERERFEILKPFLVGEKQTKAGAQLTSRLGITESAAYSAVHRLRKRYGELLREEIAHTVNRPDEIEEELQYLARVLSQ
jgi:RNA polymerase sigma factor (sigma-70 family)